MDQMSDKETAAREEQGQQQQREQKQNFLQLATKLRVARNAVRSHGEKKREDDAADASLLVTWQEVTRAYAAGAAAAPGLRRENSGEDVTPRPPSSTIEVYSMPANPAFGSSTRVLQRRSRNRQNRGGQNATDTIASQVLTRNSREKCVRHFNSVPQIREAYRQIRVQEEELSAMISLKQRKAHRQRLRVFDNKATHPVRNELNYPAILQGASIMSGLVYRRDCLDEFSLSTRVAEARRCLRAGKPVRLICSMKDNDESLDSCRLMLMTIQSRLAVFCDTPNASDMVPNRAGDIILDMIPAQRFKECMN